MAKETLRLYILQKTVSSPYDTIDCDAQKKGTVVIAEMKDMKI